MNEELLRLNSVSIDYKVRDGYLSAVNNVSLTMNKSEIFANLAAGNQQLLIL